MHALESTINNLFEIQEDLIREFKNSKFLIRNIYSEINYDNNATAIVGLRGVGKTTFLIHEAILNNAIERQVLYISADDIALQDHRLIDITDFLYKQLGIKKIYIDEIHKYQDWKQELKNIADRYPSMRVIFTSSSAIDLVHSKYDLSRRVSFIQMPGLSFREFLQFKLGLELPVIEISEILENPRSINQKILEQLKQPLVEFNHYLDSGYYPLFLRFSNKRDLYSAIENSVKKNDI